MAKKSAAQIRRMKERAAARGETYETPSLTSPTTKTTKTTTKTGGSAQRKNDDETTPRHAAGDGDDAAETETETERIHVRTIAKRLRKELAAVAENAGSTTAKERRAAKRKAEAVAAEEAGVSVAELLSTAISDDEEDEKGKEKDGKDAEDGDAKATNTTSSTEGAGGGPYVLFVGQIPFSTTHDALLEHFRRGLRRDDDLGDAATSLCVRLLTDPATGKSRGTAFVETSDPAAMHACLRLHRSHLDGRRINVERSAGGGRVARRERHEARRVEQRRVIDDAVDRLLEDRRARGVLAEDELDEGVAALCRRHAVAAVEAALDEYVDARDAYNNGRGPNNPSAYLTKILGRIAAEGARETKTTGEGGERSSDGGGKRYGEDRGDDDDDDRPTKARKTTDNQTTKRPIDNANDSSDLSRIFPSMTRGRGRGGRGRGR